MGQPGRSMLDWMLSPSLEPPQAPRACPRSLGSFTFEIVGYDDFAHVRLPTVTACDRNSMNWSM
jgi:hypothetical protein